MDIPELGNCAEAEVFERATMPELLEGGGSRVSPTLFDFDQAVKFNLELRSMTTYQ
jgi:hypothetical protein